MSVNDQNNIKEQVKEKYGSLARQFTDFGTGDMLTVLNNPAAVSCCSSGGCCDTAGVTSGDYWGKSLYDGPAVADLPDSVTGISLGCGDPVSIAELRPGQTVLDLGSGGGIDCFLAARAVGESGHVIGVDMTESMLALANQNKAKMGLTNVEFRRGEIENLPVADDSVDVIISNCVINLSPDKDAVFREAYRVLKPGGRLTVSDMVTEGQFPEQLRQNVLPWAGCVSGALDQADYLAKLRAAGFAEVAVASRKSYGLEALEGLDAASRQAITQGVEEIPAEVRLYSARIVARKAAE
jgi:ubiquinone/menaquinone biosynthesis C-methylase UbiE